MADDHVVIADLVKAKPARTNLCNKHRDADLALNAMLVPPQNAALLGGPCVEELIPPGRVETGRFRKGLYFTHVLSIPPTRLNLG